MKKDYPDIQALENEKWQDPDPATGKLGTRVPAKWLQNTEDSIKSLTNEMLEVLKEAGINADELNNTQLLAALKKIINADTKVKPIAEGGTGATTAVNARKNLGLGSSATLNTTDTFGTSTNLVATQLLVDKLQKEMFDAMPVGVIVSWDHEEAPKNWLFVRDQKFSATEYPELEKLYPKLLLNDRRGTVDRALDAGRGFDAGRVLGSYQEDDFKSHAHIDPFLENKGNAGGSQDNSSAYGKVFLGARESQAAPFPGAAAGATSQRSGGVETRMKNVATNKIIKAK